MKKFQGIIFTHFTLKKSPHEVNEKPKGIMFCISSWTKFDW